jgi:hypothetical protein
MDILDFRTLKGLPLGCGVKLIHQQIQLPTASHPVLSDTCSQRPQVGVSEPACSCHLSSIQFVLLMKYEWRTKNFLVVMKT